MWKSARRFLESPLVRVFGALFVVLTIGCAFHADGAFLRFETHRDTWRELAVRGLLAAGLTPVILAGGIDLSVGSILGFSAVLFAKLSLAERWHPLAAVLATLLAGVALGSCNGLLVALFKIQPFVATLATMTAARGLAKSLAGGRKISTAIERSDGSFDYLAPPEFFEFCNGRVLGETIAVVTVVLMVLLGALHLLLAHFVVGRRIYAVGDNVEAARLAGVPIAPTKILAYAVSGLAAGVAGVCQATQEYQGDPEAGAGYELSAIAMVVIGGTALTGGRGGVGLTAVGVLVIGYLEKILSLNAVEESGRLVLTGVIIVLAVLLQRRSA